MTPPLCSCPTSNPETFWTLLHDLAHWEFEGFLMLIDNFVIGGLVLGLLWPKIKEHWAHHLARDKMDGIK